MLFIEIAMIIKIEKNDYIIELENERRVLKKKCDNDCIECKMDRVFICEIYF